MAIEVTLESASNLPRLDTIPGRIDPYGIIRVMNGDQVVVCSKSPAKWRNFDPVWNHSFQFVVAPADMAATRINVQIFDEDLIEDEYAGDVTFPLQDLLAAPGCGALNLVTGLKPHDKTRPALVRVSARQILELAPVYVALSGSSSSFYLPSSSSSFSLTPSSSTDQSTSSSTLPPVSSALSSSSSSPASSSSIPSLPIPSTPKIVSVSSAAPPASSSSAYSSLLPVLLVVLLLILPPLPLPFIFIVAVVVFSLTSSSSSSTKDRISNFFASSPSQDDIIVTLDVIKGETLPKMDILKCDPFVVVTVIDSSNGDVLFSGQTPVIKQEYDPEWNFTFQFRLNPRATKPLLRLVVRDKDYGRKVQGAGAYEMTIRETSGVERFQLVLASNKKPSRRALASYLHTQIRFSKPAPAIWADTPSDTQIKGVSYRFKRGLWRRILEDEEVQLRVLQVENMDGPSLDRHFRMGLITEIKPLMNTGDIMLFRGSEPFSQQIRIGTMSNWSHSIFVIRNPSPELKAAFRFQEYVERDPSAASEDLFVFEAETETLLRNPNGVPDGVQMVPFDHWLRHYREAYGPEFLLVWRRLVTMDNQPPNFPPEQLARLNTWMLSCAGKRYKQSKKQCYAAIIRANAHKDYSSFFCSELVAATLAEFGIFPDYKWRLFNFQERRERLASNCLPCDFSSEERHDGKDIKLLPPYKLLLERRIRIEPSPGSADQGLGVVPINDVIRHALRTRYEKVAPLEELLKTHLLGNDPRDIAKLFSLPRPDRHNNLDPRGNAEQCGWLRPLMALASLHPYLRLQFAKVLDVDIWSPSWYGDPIREAYEILRSLVFHGQSQNWLETLVQTAKTKTFDAKHSLPHLGAGLTLESLSNGPTAIPLELIFLHSTSPRMYRRVFKVKEDSPDSWSRIFGLETFPRSLADLKAHLQNVDPAHVESLVQNLSDYGVQDESLWRMAILFLSGAWRNFVLEHFLTWLAVEATADNKADRHQNVLYPLFGLLINQLVLLHLAGLSV